MRAGGASGRGCAGREAVAEYLPIIEVPAEGVRAVCVVAGGWCQSLWYSRVEEAKVQQRMGRIGQYRRIFWGSILGSLLLVALMAPGAGAATPPLTNLVSNGSFEQPGLSAGQYRIFASIPGWTTRAGAGPEIQNNIGLGVAAHGQQYVELASHNPSAIGQQVSTIPGGTYTLSFAFRARPGTPLADNAVEVAVDGTVLGTVTATDSSFYTTWYRYSYTIVATGATTDIALADRGGVANSLGTFIDDVRVVPAYQLCDVLYDQYKTHRGGSTVPIKFQICDAGGANVSAAGIVVHATGLTQLDASATSVIDDAGASNSPDNDFRYDAALGGTGGYIFNLKTTGLLTGTYTLTFTIDGVSDPTYAVQFDVR